MVVVVKVIVKITGKWFRSPHGKYILFAVSLYKNKIVNSIGLLSLSILENPDYLVSHICDSRNIRARVQLSKNEKKYVVFP